MLTVPVRNIFISHATNTVEILSITLNVLFSVYCDPRQLAPHVDFVTLNVFDFYTPNRNPKEADFTAPLYSLHERKKDENADFQVRYW